MIFTILFPFLYHFKGRGGVKTFHERFESEGGNLTHTKAKFREGGCKNLIKPDISEVFNWLNGEHGLFTGREAVS